MYFFVLLDDTLNVTPLDSQEQSAVEEERPRFLQKGNSWTFRHFILTYYRHSFSNRHSPRKFFVSDYTKWTPSGTLYTFHILYTYYNFARMTIVIHRVLSIRLSMGSVKWAVFGGGDPIEQTCRNRVLPCQSEIIVPRQWMTAFVLVSSLIRTALFDGEAGSFYDAC